MVNKKNHVSFFQKDKLIKSKDKIRKNNKRKMLKLLKNNNKNQLLR